MYEGNLPMSDLSPVIGFDPKDKIFFNDDRTLGFGFVCTPLPYANAELMDQFKTFLGLEFPEGTTISFMLYRSPDIDQFLDRMILLRNFYRDELLTPMLLDRAQFLREHTDKPLVTDYNGQHYDCGRIVDVKLVITVKIPAGNGIDPKPKDLDKARDMQRRSLASLRECRFAPQEMRDQDFVRIMSTLVNWGPGASWKGSATVADPYTALNEQFYDTDTDLDDSDPTRSYISLHERVDAKEGDPENKYECYVQVLSPRELPPSCFFGDAVLYAGDLTGKGNSANISGNYAVVSTIHYINHTRVFDHIKRKRSLTSKAAFAPVLLKARPEMADAISDYDEIYRSVNGGAQLVQMTFEIVIFAPTRSLLTQTSQAMQQYFSTLKFKLMVDRYIQRELFMNCLPFSCDRKFMFGMESRRFHTVTTDVALVLLPVFSEWKGTGTGHVALISRTGQIMSVSLNDSSTNNNALIAAESGSGKSFYTNEVLAMYMSEGAKVWIIDIGRSYQKLCNILHGEFINFRLEDLPCMNPFKMVRNIEEEHDSVISVLEAMISPRGELSPTQESILTRIFDELWEQHENDLTVDMIEQALYKYAREKNDKRVEDMAVQIYDYTTRGQYGKVFNEGTPKTFNNRMTVLELEELTAYPNLRRVILLQLIFQIQQAIYLSPDRSQRKLVMIDEAWDLLKEGETAKFMEGAYRKFRKYGASAIIATQAISDLYNGAGNNVGQAIANNSAFYFLLGQKPATVEQVKEHKYLDISDGGYELLKTVHTEKGVYSEIFINSNAGTGIGRLIVSDFEKLMFSTDARDIAALNQYVNKGATYSEAINQVLIDQRKLDAVRFTKDEKQPLGRLLGEDELKRYMERRHVPVTDETVVKYENAFWDPDLGRLVFADGSNLRNPAYARPVYRPVEDGEARK